MSATFWIETVERTITNPVQRVILNLPGSDAAPIVVIDHAAA
jgi:hypothetical protein